MTFLAAFDARGAPIDVTAMVPAEAASREIQLLGRHKQAAFACWSRGALGQGRCASRIVELDRRLWLVGRVRLDRRKELAERLGASAAESDPLLCLRSYARWNDGCVEHLRGDFCFAIWDEARRCLFCARDQLGVRPLFHEQARSSWLVSDSLAVLSTRPDGNRELDELWVGDFLTRPQSLDFDRTVYKGIKRLAPAHALRISSQGGETKRYWALEPLEPNIHNREGEYLDRFHELLARAVADRLPEGRVGVMMSGGIDSTTLAAKTVDAAGDPARVVAFTGYFERLYPDDGPHYSGVAARSLGISQTLFALDDLYGATAAVDVAAAQEPGAPSLFNPARRAMEEKMESLAGVWLLGEGPDNALTFEWKAYLRWLLRKGDWQSLATAAARYLVQKRPREWLSTAMKVTPATSGSASARPVPDWLDETLAERLLARSSSQAPRRPNGAWWKPGAMESFTSTIWPTYFEVWDPATSGTRLDFRHPYLDLELLIFMLRTPPIPWGRRKALLRKAMRGRLPVEILERDKVPADGALARGVGRKQHPPSIEVGNGLQRFINRPKLAEAGASGDAIERIEVLDAWLKRNGFESRNSA